MIALGIAFFGLLAVALLQGAKPFVYDAWEYWALGDSFIQHGGFSLPSFDSPLRGYLLPLTNHGLGEIADGLEWKDSVAVAVFNALTFALITTVLAPSLAALAWPERRWGLLRRIALAALLIVFWRGYLNFPLSDFPALAAVLLALVAIAHPGHPGWTLVAGVAAGAAINMRPAYLLLAPVLIVLLALAWRDQSRGPQASTARRALCLGLLVLGFVAVSLPQSLASHRNHATWSFIPGTAAGLSKLQLTQGMQLQRYETYVGTGEAGPGMFYQDEAGARLLWEQANGTIDGAGQYLDVVARHPLTMGGVVARHVINGLDQRYSTPYVQHLDKGSHRWMRLFGFLLVFLALARVAWPCLRHSLGPARWRYPAGLLVCGMASLASAVETRFLLPVYLLSYVLVLTPGWQSPFVSPEPGRRRLRDAAVLVFAFAAFLAIVVYVTDGATDRLRIG